MEYSIWYVNMHMGQRLYQIYKEIIGTFESDLLLMVSCAKEILLKAKCVL